MRQSSDNKVVVCTKPTISKRKIFDCGLLSHSIAIILSIAILKISKYSLSVMMIMCGVMHGGRRRARRRGRMERSERRRKLKRQETTTACGPSTHRISIRHYSLSSILCHCHIQSFHSFYHFDMTNCFIFLFYNFLVVT